MRFDELTTVRVTHAGGVATILLSRPERLNAYTLLMGQELFGALGALDADDDVRAIVVTGAGRAFCAGMDLEAGGETFVDPKQWEATRRLERATRPWNMSTPVIAAINGPAVGIGATLPLQWDIRLAAKSARLGFVFARRGIVPEAHSTWILPRLVGMSRALELLLSGRILGADEALSYGLVSQVLPDDQLLARAQELARDIAENTAPVSVAITKRLLWRQLMDNDAEAAKAREDEAFTWAGRQADAAEGVRSFLEKRPPRWSMKPSRDLPTWLRTQLDDKAPGIDGETEGGTGDWE
jgi:enoyl-CoA hydratase/carnithine racemase